MNMNVPNMGLQKVLQESLPGQNQPAQNIMDSPFPDIGAPANAAAPTPMTAEIFSSKEGNFDQLAKQYGLDLKGMNSNPGLGKLQLMERLQKQFGADYMQRPEARAIMESFMRRAAQPNIDEERSLRVATAAAQRTLKGILG